MVVYENKLFIAWLRKLKIYNSDKYLEKTIENKN